MDDVNEEEVKIEEDEIKIEIREEVENNSEQICNPCPAICKTSKSLLRHKMEVIGAQIQMQKRSCQNILFSSVNISG